jgi:hypothetical protein
VYDRSSGFSVSLLSTMSDICMSAATSFGTYMNAGGGEPPAFSPTTTVPVFGASGPQISSLQKRSIPRCAPLKATRRVSYFE